MRTLLILLFFSGLYTSDFAQIITVIDSESRQPIELATFISKQPKAYTTTNAKGQTDLSDFKGAEEIVIRVLGYGTERKSYKQLAGDSLLALMPSTLSLDQVIVSATRWNQYGGDVPLKISTISPKTVSLQNPQTAADLLALSGEVFVQKSQQGGGSPMIRGFATNRLLYAIDGVRMNTAIFRSGNLQNVISLDPFAIEKSEVLFGPGSVIYGSDAIGGVMNFRTLTPQFSLTDDPLISGSAVTRYATANNELTGHFNVQVGWSDFAFVTSFSSNDFGDLRMGQYGPDEYLRPFYVERHNNDDVIIDNNEPRQQVPTGYSQINLMQKFRYMPAKEWEFEYGLHYSSTSDFPRYDRLIRTRNGKPRSGEWHYGPQIWAMNNFSLTNHQSNFFYDEMNFRAAYQFFEESRIDRDFGDTLRFRRVEQVDAYSLNIDFLKETSSALKLFYGFEVVLNDVTSTGTSENITDGATTKASARYPLSTWESYAAYITLQYRLSEQWLLQAGSRYNQFMLDADFSNNTAFFPLPFTDASINSGAITGSTGFVFSPDNSFHISGNFSTGFRSPNVDDIGKIFDSEPGSVVVPNPNLDAEYAYNGELTFSKVFDDAVKLDLTGYYTLLDDAMVRRDFTLDGKDSIPYDGEMSRIQAIQNAAKATVYGLQAGFEIKLPSGFGFSSQINVQKGEEEMDDGSTYPSRHAAPWFGVSRLTYQANRLYLQLYAAYSGEIEYDDLNIEERGKPYLYAADENGNPYSPSWYTLNFKAMHRLSNVFTLTAGVENITDRRYRPYSSGLAAPGRNFILSIKASL